MWSYKCPNSYLAITIILQSSVLDITYPVNDGADGLVPALEDLCMRAAQAASHGYTLLVLSDRAAGPERVPIRLIKILF